MKKLLTRALLWSVMLPALAGAQPWTFLDAIDVVRAPHEAKGARVFIHLESAGRRNIAVSGDWVAVVWEDNRGALPGIYIAYKALTGQAFSAPLLLSGAGEAYEPSIAALPDGAFALAWEEDGALFMTRFQPGKQRQVATRLLKQAAQASLAAAGARLALAWTDTSARHPRVRVAEVRFAGGAAVLGKIRPADIAPPVNEQAYPSLVYLGTDLFLAWEDRRSGHTRILYDRVGDGIDLPRMLNRVRVSPKTQFGSGYGAARPALASAGMFLAGVWSDKRDFLSGYDVYAGISGDGGRRFGANHPVQDEFGGSYAQWHPAVAGHDSGLLVAAWDDDREGHGDVLLSWRAAGDEAWSDDMNIGTGPGDQVHPTLTLDAAGNLHIAWLESADADTPARIRYRFGKRLRPE